MGLFVLIFLIATLGLPGGILYLIIEILLSYSNDKATKEKIKKAMPVFQDRQTDKTSPSFPDLQRTVGGKMSGSADKAGTSPSEGSADGRAASAGSGTPSYTYTSNGTAVSGSTVKSGAEAQAGAAKGTFRTGEKYARQVRKPKRSILTTAAAAGLFTVSGISLWTVLVDVFYGISQGSLDLISYADQIPSLLISIICLIAGIWLTYSKKRKYDRQNRYIAIINQGYGMIPIDNICYLFPEKYDTCVQELQEMINSGILPGAYIDYGRHLLVIDPNNSSMEPVIQQSRGAAGSGSSSERGASEAPAKKQGSRKKKISEQKIDFLSLERLSKRVKDEDIKMKLIRISSTLKTIGLKVEEDPEIRKAAGVDTFMDMYLPKTIRLVEDYEEVSAISGVPHNEELKKSVLETLDAIDDATMTLWKDIIHSDVIDISAELEALQTKLTLDGYKKSDLEPESMPSGFTFNDMDISEERPAAEGRAQAGGKAEKLREAMISAEIKSEEAAAEMEARRKEAEEAEARKKAEEAAREAEDDAVRSAKEAEDKDAAMEADLFAKLRAQQQKEKELLK